MEFELEASVVAAIPCPPLPIVVFGADSNDQRAFPSHSIVKSVFHNMSKHSSMMAKTRHRVALAMAEQTLFKSIDKLGDSITNEEAYGVFRTYMYDILLASPCVHPDIRFFPLEYTSKGDIIHQSVCDHAKAQDLLYNNTVPITAYSEMEYPDLILMYAKRILYAK